VARRRGAAVDAVFGSGVIPEKKQKPTKPVAGFGGLLCRKRGDTTLCPLRWYIAEPVPTLKGLKYAFGPWEILNSAAFLG
jgi:hypothetical protein